MSKELDYIIANSHPSTLVRQLAVALKSPRCPAYIRELEEAVLDSGVAAVRYYLKREQVYKAIKNCDTAAIDELGIAILVGMVDPYADYSDDGAVWRHNQAVLRLIDMWRKENPLVDMPTSIKANAVAKAAYAIFSENVNDKLKLTSVGPRNIEELRWALDHDVGAEDATFELRRTLIAIADGARDWMAKNPMTYITLDSKVAKDLNWPTLALSSEMEKMFQKVVELFDEGTRLLPDGPSYLFDIQMLVREFPMGDRRQPRKEERPVITWRRSYNKSWVLVL